jgi:hypothetical protein
VAVVCGFPPLLEGNLSQMSGSGKMSALKPAAFKQVAVYLHDTIGLKRVASVFANGHSKLAGITQMDKLRLLATARSLTDMENTLTSWSVNFTWKRPKESGDGAELL